MNNPTAPASSFVLRHFIGIGPTNSTSVVSGAPACPSRSLQRSVDMTTGTRSHVPTTVFHEASSLRQCGGSFETWKLTLMPFRCSFICAMRCTGLELCVPPRASDRLKCTSNDAQHEVKGSCQPPTAKTPVATTIVQDDSSALLRRTTRS